MPTKIEWADESWNPVTGCTPISEGCTHCYAKRMAQRLKGRAGYPQDDPFKVTFHPDKLMKPLHWKKPRRIFVVSMGDLFHEKVSDEQIGMVLCITQIANQHTYLFLTKRPERMAEMFYREDLTLDFNTDNIWCGISASNQDDLDRWTPILLEIPAAKRFLSLEPFLGSVDLRFHFTEPTGNFWTNKGKRQMELKPHNKINWVIAGGESGPRFRPSHPDWFRRVRDDCAATGVPFFMKQMSGRTKVEREAIPEDLMIKEWPGE